MNIVLRTPEAITAYVLENYAAVSEQQIGQFERDVVAAFPRSDELGLLYALRVSKCLPTLKSFKTINSRWSVASGVDKLCGGTGTFTGGLSDGMGSPNYQRTLDFLTALYTQRVEELCAEIATKAESDAAARKTASAKENVYYAAIEKITDPIEAGTFLSYERRTAWEDYLLAKLGDLPAPEEKQKVPKSKPVKGKCEGCGKEPRVLTKIESGQLICGSCLREIRS